MFAFKKFFAISCAACVALFLVQGCKKKSDPTACRNISFANGIPEDKQLFWEGEEHERCNDCLNRFNIRADGTRKEKIMLANKADKHCGARGLAQFWGV